MNENNEIPIQNSILSINIYEVFLVFIIVLGISNVAFLTFGRFSPAISIIFSIIILGVFLAFLKILHFSIHFFPIRFNKLFLSIMVLGLLIRFPPTLYIMGGQDQGTYINMANQYIKSGKLYAIDHFRETLSKSQKALYDRDGSYIMPSIEKWNRPNSEYSMVFYPLYPSMLSIGSYVFGQNNSVYILTIFSLITLVNIYLITFLLTKNKFTSAVVLLLLVINPVHVFFSKFPVGEICALVFSTSGFYFLLKYLQQNQIYNYKNLLFLKLSLFAFLGFMLTRMTYFIYLPVIFIILTVSAIAVQNKRIKISLSIYYFLNLVFLIFTTNIFYKTVLFPVYERIYPNTLGLLVDKIIPFHINGGIKIFVIFGLPYLLILFINQHKNKILGSLDKNFKLISSLFFIIVFILIGFFTTKLMDGLFNNINPVFYRWNIPNRGLDSLKHLPIFSIANYTGIIGLILFLIFIIKAVVSKSYKHTILAIISLYFILINVYYLGFMRYEYYNARYYLTETIPMILLTVGILLSGVYSKNKKIFYIVLTPLLIINLTFSYFQFLGPEGPDLKFYNKIISRTESDSLLVYINQRLDNDKYSNNFNLYIAGPLKYYFNRNVLVLRSPQEVTNPEASGIINKFDKIYYLSNTPLDELKGYSNEEKDTLIYTYYNNSPGCNYHNYEFLDKKNVIQFKLPNFIKCKLLPNAYFVRQRDYYIGELKI